MDHSDKISKVQSRLNELEKISKDLYEVEERILHIEDELCNIDEALPHGAVTNAAEREQIRLITGLLDRSYALIDELLGPPDEGLPSTTDLYGRPLS